MLDARVIPPVGDRSHLGNLLEAEREQLHALVDANGMKSKHAIRQSRKIDRLVNIFMARRKAAGKS